MKITFLGTGTSQGIPVIGCECHTCISTSDKDKRLRVSCCVEVNDKRIVIDAGPDFRQQMLKIGGQEIHAVLITHEHNDHVAGIDDVRPFNFKYHKNMPIYCLERVANEIRSRYNYIFKEQQYPGAPQITLHQIQAGVSFEFEGITIQTIDILHGELPILGFRIGNFAYLTDVKTIDESQFSFLKNLDVVVLNALRKEAHHSHLTLEEAIEMAQKIGAKRSYFTHFSHHLGRHDEIQKMLPKNIFAAYDGLEVEM